MKVFLSHSSHNKPLMRELREHLPGLIHPWIDEDELLVSDYLAESLQQTIAADSDFFVLFVDQGSAKSEWVKREIGWALATERRLGRTFIIPVVLDESAWDTFEPKELRGRKYLLCAAFTKDGIANLAKVLSSQVFLLFIRDLQAKEMEGQGDRLPVVKAAEGFLRALADDIRTVVYSYWEYDSLKVERLYAILHTRHAVPVPVSLEQFHWLLAYLQQKRLLTGLDVDGEEVFVREEEHFSLKVRTFVDEKKRIAKRAVSLVRSGDVIALDGGSTTNEIAKQLGRRVKSHRLRGLRVVTNSLPAAHELMSIVTEMGLEDNTETIQVFVVGGRVRPNTLAIVQLEYGSGSEVRDLLSATGGASVCFVGTNGVSDSGFTTRVMAEAQIKTAMLSLSKRKVIVTDASKFGLRQEQIFAGFDSGIEVITVRDGFERPLQLYEALLALRDTTFTYA